MDPKEYANLAEVERRHWFYVGKRQIVRYWIRHIRPLRPNELLVDCGAGTGTFASEMAGLAQVLAVDDHEESLALAREKLGAERVLRGSCMDLPLSAQSVDVLTALDVIEHVGDDHQALVEFARVTRVGGLVVITVPALRLLWSDWDVALQHLRRYTRRSLLDVIPIDRFDVVSCHYINVAAFLPVLLVRKWRAFKQWRGTAIDSRSEDAIPAPWLNTLLRWSFVGLACQSWIRFPVGVGLIAVLRRR